VHVLTVRGAISPASADYLVRGIDKAAAAKARLVVIEMDTPGGLDTAMRDIIKAILASSVPVATYVSPQGARAWRTVVGAKPPAAGARGKSAGHGAARPDSGSGTDTLNEQGEQPCLTSAGLPLHYWH
jgi:hypothetical protein